MWGWYRESNPYGDGVVRYGVTTSITATVVTIINTVLMKTSVTTLMPPDYTPPPTNAAGTRVEAITYTRNGKESTTVLYAALPDHVGVANHVSSAFPTFFVNWGSFYLMKGTMAMTRGTPATTTECVTNTGWSTYSLTSQPQPTAIPPQFNPLETESIDDPRGLKYSLAINFQEYWQFNVLSTLFPDQPAFSSCRGDSIGPNWVGFTQTNWYTQTSTTITGR